ncbi:MAG TPA: peptidoglycan-binding protein [Pyrinomonadaceae bacterium]
MARVIFAKGVRGEIVRKMQRRLIDLGFNTQGVDGDYGNNTEKAVKAFQKSRGMEQTGEVDTTAFETLMGTGIPSVKERALQVTAAFEGHDFTLAQGNFDGAGITWGIIGFTLRHGELKKIILQINGQHPALVREAFGAKTEELIAVMNSSLSKQIAFADSVSIGASKVRLAEPWRTGFRKFGEMKEVQDLQLELVDQDFFKPAVKTAAKFGLKSELGIALAFDIHVQNGSIKDSAREQIEREKAAHPITKERELRNIIGQAVADKSNPSFREDVRSRKITIATGSGKVHGSTYILRNWGLDETPFEG